MRRRALCGAILGLAGLWLWLLAVGAERPGSLGSPAGDGALCLALLAWWCGAAAGPAAVLWSLDLLGSTALTGLSPCWPFLLALPAWLAVRALGGRRGRLAYLLLAAGLTSCFRFAGKLLLLAAAPGTALTLSGATLAGSFWAELAPNLMFCLLFALLLGAPPIRARRGLA